MAIIQALFSLLSRSLGKVLNAIFGWAVVALFGQTTPAQKTLLSGLVALAAAWPVLLIGVAFPKVAGMVLAFLPPSAQGPTWLMRVIWLSIAVAVPLTIGLVVASRAPPGSPREPFVKRALRGFPITIALAGAFLLTFISVPFMRVSAVLKRRKDEHVPLVTTGDAYQDVAEKIDKRLELQGIDASRTDPPWWLSAPTKILLKLGGRAFRGFIPEKLAYWRGPQLEIALYPSDLLARGARRLTAFIHGVITEDLVRSEALQTFEPPAQEIERQIRRVWRVYEENPAAHTESDALLGRVDDLTEELEKVDVPYEEWSILYRQIAQLSRAIEGKYQLLAKGKDMTKEAEAKTAPAMSAPGRTHTPPPPRPNALPSGQLMAETAREAIALVRSQIELAKVELKQDLQSEIKAAKGLSIAAVCGLMMLNMLLVAVAFALVTVMPAWAAALAIAGVVAFVGGIAGVFGWKHVKVPLVRTRKSVEEDVRWVKERTA
jgi:uncharacterized membrane protein YqjE